MRRSAKQEARWFVILVPVILVFLAIVMLGVSKNATPPDPNDPKQNPEIAVELAEKNIEQLFWILDGRVRRKEITVKQSRELLQKYADDLTGSLSTVNIRRSDAYRYGEILRTAHRWKEAQNYFEMAMEQEAKNADRVVNCRVRIAHCLAEQKLPEEAIEIARTSFEAPPGNKPSILLGLYMQMVPAARGQGRDLELAHLLDEAVDQHLQSIIDPTTLPGQAFLNSRKHHIKAALNLAIELSEGDQAYMESLKTKVQDLLSRL